MNVFAAILGAGLALMLSVPRDGDTAAVIYPKDPIRLIATHAPGGNVDLNARLVQPYLQKYLGVPIVVENMPGAGGNISRSYVFKQPPDGYSLLISVQPSMSAGQIISGGRFEALKFTHVFNITGGNYDAILLPYDSPWKTIEDIKKASETQPITVAGAGVGTNPYIFIMLLKTKVGINLTFVPFNSGSEVGLTVAGSQVHMGVAQITSAWSLVEQKRLRVLAVDGAQRHESYPQFPTMTELGYPNIKLDQLVGVFAPPGLPKERLDTLVAAFRKTIADKDFIAAAKKAQVPLRPMEPAEFFKVDSDLFEMIKELGPLLKPGKGS
jgi:tripartite-type tricarboxylate transporter receptor subunit TctC